MLLADASKRLAESLDLQRTLRCMVEVSVPALGEACIVYLLAEGYTRGQIAAAKHVDKHREARLTGLAQAALRKPHGWQPILRVAATGRCAVLSPLNTAALLDDGRFPHVLLGELGIRTALAIPLRAGERTRAVLIVFTDRVRHYTPNRVRLGVELASRFGLALEAAEMYRACKASLHQTQETLATTIHDVMSPLSYIKGMTQRLRRVENRFDDPAEFADFKGRLEGIDAAVNRTAAALSSLAQTARISPESSTMATHQSMDLVALVRSTVTAEQLVSRQHVIRILSAPPVLEGAWDADRLERLLSNLISNAVKYSPTGRSIDVTLNCEVDNEGRWAVLRVIDHGVGIPARDLPFVFEPFRRGSNVGSVSGTGLGLASVWQTVKASDGRLWVESDEGKGTRVTVHLPLDEASIAPTTSASSNGSVTPTTCRA